MRFRQLDQVLQLTPGVSIAARRTLSGSEAYFRDHFPNFQVMPGVLMLESLFQACNWLVRKTDEFAHSVVILKEARNVKFAGFVRPGETLTVTATVKSPADHSTRLAAQAEVGGKTVVSGQLVLERFNLCERYGQCQASDAHLRKEMRAEFARLQPGSPDNCPVVPSHYRWMWIDRFTEFVAGRRATAVKAVSLVDEPMNLYMPRFPIMPCSLILEGFAQTGGILVSESQRFEKRVVLAKVSKAVFHRPAIAGDLLRYSTEIESLQPDGALVRGRSCIGDEPHADVELFFAFLDDRIINVDLIAPFDLLTMLRVFRLYDVGRKEDGSPLEVPPRYLAAEQAVCEGH